MTSGIVPVAGAGGGGGGAALAPWARFTRTFEPRGARAPAAGCCATTVPFGCADGTLNTVATSPAPRIAATAAARLWPTTFGTFTRPRETRITAVEPLATLLPAAGVWLITVPFGFDEATPLVSTVRPFARSALTAVAVLSAP